MLRVTHACSGVTSCVPSVVCTYPLTHLAPVFCQWNSKAGRVLFLAKINVIGSLVFRMENPAGLSLLHYLLR